ncbi:uncharacterized protein LOC135845298 [Planococcus citri]|uniref:uncharacterized protein LOC135845298 n=1 Tax=Planococcus citri TaxID=170843 RepID=UPI0031F7D405
MPNTRSGGAGAANNEKNDQPVQPPPNATPIMSEEQIRQMVTGQFSTLVSLIQSGKLVLPNVTNTNTEESRLAELDKAYRTPPFIIPSFHESEKLQGYKNFKSWKIKLELSLEALMLLPFIKTDGGQAVNISQGRRDVLNAQTLQVLQASLSRSNTYLIQNLKSACDAFNLLSKTYSTTRMRDYVQLNNRLARVYFKPGYDPVRFATDFENCIEDFTQMGTTFNQEFITSMFLNKISGIYDPKTIYFSFYNNIASLTDMPEFQTVKDGFLQLEHKSIPRQPLAKPSDDKDKRKRSSNDSSGAPSTKRHTDDKRNTGSVQPPPKRKYTDEQILKLKSMSPDEKRAVQCSKCSEYFHTAETCVNPGRLCFNCHGYGHEAKDCPKPPRKNDKRNEK